MRCTVSACRNADLGAAESFCNTQISPFEKRNIAQDCGRLKDILGTFDMITGVLLCFIQLVISCQRHSWHISRSTFTVVGATMTGTFAPACYGIVRAATSRTGTCECIKTSIFAVVSQRRHRHCGNPPQRACFTLGKAKHIGVWSSVRQPTSVCLNHEQFSFRFSWKISNSLIFSKAFAIATSSVEYSF